MSQTLRNQAASIQGLCAMVGLAADMVMRRGLRSLGSKDIQIAEERRDLRGR